MRFYEHKIVCLQERLVNAGSALGAKSVSQSDDTALLEGSSSQNVHRKLTMTIITVGYMPEIWLPMHVIIL
jgi:hypothetical protein